MEGLLSIDNFAKFLILELSNVNVFCGQDLV